MRVCVKSVGLLLVGVVGVLGMTACGNGPEYGPDPSAQPIHVLTPTTSPDPAEEKKLRDHEEALIKQGFKVVKGTMVTGVMTYVDSRGNTLSVKQRIVSLDLGCPPSKAKTQVFSVPDWTEPPYKLIWSTNLLEGLREVPFTTQPTDREIIWFGLCA